VKLPSSQTNGSFNPTGITFNANTNEFAVSAGGKSGAASLIYSGEAGMIAGWSGSVDANNAVFAYTDDGGAAYKGLALANNGSADFLYATEFRNNKVDVFDSTFAKQPAGVFPFSDPQLPSGYAPFGIRAIQNGSGGTWQLYVTYAQQAGSVGSAGDGKINAFDPSSGAFVAAVADGTGAAFSVTGLWGIAFGNDAANQPHNTLFYAAGTNDEKNGDYGRIDVNASGSTPTPPPPGY